MGKIADTTRTEVHWMRPDDSRLLVITDRSHKLYDERVEIPLDDPKLVALTESIREEGILEPVIVRRVGDHFEVMDGRQRVRCAREAFRTGANMLRIPFIVRTMGDFQAAKIATVLNVQRIGDTPIIKGRNASRLIEMGADDEELERTFGVKRSTIEGWIALYNAPRIVQEFVEEGKISPTDGIKVARKAHKGEDAVKAELEKIRSKASEPKAERVRIVLERREGIWLITGAPDLMGPELTGIREALLNYLGGL